MERTLIKDVLGGSQIGQEVAVAGWVRTLRTSKGGFSFIALNDGSCMANLQIVADQSLPNYQDQIIHLTTGSSLQVRGTLVASQGKGQRVELKAAEIALLGTADAAAYPIQQKHHTFEFLRTVAHLRPRTNTFGAVARVRSALSLAVHEFFQNRGFVYVHTPIVTASDCEGAGQMFRVSTLDMANPPRTPDGAVDFAQDFFGRSTYLTVSGQLEGETYACALGNVYTFGPTFRAENSNTPRHLAEFWMVEPEVAFCDLAGDADLAESFLKFLFQTVLTRCKEDMEFFNQHVDNTVLETLTHIAESDFVRLSYTEAIDILQKSGKTWEFPVQWGTDLQTEHERFLTEQTFKKPVILMNYPARIKSFYMRLNDDAAEHDGQPTVAAMDVLVPKIGEIIGGSQREERLDVLLRRMDEMQMRKEDYWWYLDLRRYGTVPHAGFGLGLERTVQFVTGMANIRDVIPYPRAPRSAEFYGARLKSTMKVELHLHTARYSACSVATPNELMAALIAKGYQAVFITEHDAVWTTEELDDLRSEFPAIRIFPGVELSFGQVRQEHLVVLGTQDPGYLKMRLPAEAIQKARAEGNMSILAHPFRWKGSDTQLQETILPDAIEYRTCNQDYAAAQVALAAGERLHLPLVNAGDVHSLEMTGRFWIETNQPLQQAQDIRSAILSNAYENHTKE